MLTKVNDKLMLTDTAYSIGKKLVQIYIPAASALYFGLGAIWGLPATEQVVGTAALLATFLGVCLGLSSKQYDASGAAHDGQMEVATTEEGNKIYTLHLDGDPAELDAKESVSFKVAKK